MHLVEKIIGGNPYYYLVEKARRGRRVVTARTVYIGNWQKLAELAQSNAASGFPKSYRSQEVGASLAFADLVTELGLEELIDGICPVRAGAAPIGRQLALSAIHRALAPRWENGKSNLRGFYRSRALSDLLPFSEATLDHRRVGENLSALSPKVIEQIESAVVERVIKREGISLDALAFDCTNFDSYAAASTQSRLLKRGHGKSGKSLRALGMGLLATEDGGVPLLTFAYPGNENDVTAFARFLRALDRRRSSLRIPLAATIAADGGNISKTILGRLEGKGKERERRHYILRLPERHAGGLARVASLDLPLLEGFTGKVRAHKYESAVYKVRRCVVDVYSPRMHRRQLPGLIRDRKKAQSDLNHLQRQLELQRRGLRHLKPITMTGLRRRVTKALARQHMKDLFAVQIERGDPAPKLSFQEDENVWKHLQSHVLGRTLLVTSQKDWSVEKIVRASRLQSHDERFFRDIKDPAGASMLPLRHRVDSTLRGNALVVVLGLMLAKVMMRRLQKAGVAIRSVRGMIQQLKRIRRARMLLPDDASPALRALATTTWVPSERTQRQNEILTALGLAGRPELGTTPFSTKTRSGRPKRQKKVE